MIDKTVSVGQIMTVDVVTAKPDDRMSHIAFLFKTNDIHHIPIVDEDEKVVGIISKSDYYQILHSFTLFNKKREPELNDQFLVSHYAMQVMTKDVVKLNPNDKIDIAIGIFAENLFHAMPVVDDAGKLVGILSTYDLMSYAYNIEYPLNVQ